MQNSAELAAASNPVPEQLWLDAIPGLRGVGPTSGSAESSQVSTPTRKTATPPDGAAEPETDPTSAAAGGPSSSAESSGTSTATPQDPLSLLAAAAADEQPAADATAPAPGTPQRASKGDAGADAAAASRGGERLGACLADDDIMRIRNFVADYAGRQLLPDLQRLTALLQTVVQTARKGVGRSFIGATKRFFGGSKPAAPASPGGAAAAAGAKLPYSIGVATVEAQMRRLADFSFMLQDWETAHTM